MLARAEMLVVFVEIVEKEAVGIYSSAEDGGGCLTISGCKYSNGFALNLGKRPLCPPS
jgi:hypothetical protein